MHIQKIKVRGQLVHKVETNVRTDGQADTTDRINFPSNAVGKMYWSELLNAKATPMNIRRTYANSDIQYE